EMIMSNRIESLTSFGLNNFEMDTQIVSYGSWLVFTIAAYFALTTKRTSDKLVFMVIALLLPLAVMWNGLIGQNTTRALVIYLPYALTIFAEFLFFTLFRKKSSNHPIQEF